MKTLIKIVIFISFAVSGAWLVIAWKQKEALGSESNKKQRSQIRAEKGKSHLYLEKDTKSQVAVRQGTTERQDAILELMRRRGPVDNKLLVKELGGINERTLRRDLVRLQALGLVKKTGSTKSATYSAMV